MLGKLSRRAILFGGGATVGGLVARRYGSHLPERTGTKMPVGTGDSELILNDASGLSATPIHKHIVLKEAWDDGLVAKLRDEIQTARNEKRAVNVGAARHSMGAQAIPRNGTAITFDNGLVETNSANMTYRVHAGARWSQVTSALDPQGFSPAVMQSNNDFGVAATFCVNAHGWPVPFGPMGATVQAFRMVLPDGDLVTCSRNENSDLFNMTMGGYGLTGAIVDLEVQMVRNRNLVPTFAEMDSIDFADQFYSSIQNDTIKMAYGRLNVDRENFWQNALMITYRLAEDQSEIAPAKGSGWMSKIARNVYRAQLGSDPIKRLRWWTETDLGPSVGGGVATRNSLINEPVITLDDRDPTRTDILHEYFVSPERFAEFVAICQAIIPASYQEFLNVTLRFIARDTESVLAYATSDRIAAVMSFSQEITARAEADMARMTRALIDAVADIGGAYYLPYRPHASIDQLRRTYANAGSFAEGKRALDPDLVFRNNLWDGYLGAL